MVDVKDGATATLLKDMTVERAAEAARSAPPPVAPPAPENDVQRTVTPQAPPTPAVEAVAPGLKAAPPLSSTEKGSLEISSPGLYGVVWINGRPRGYPPLEVRDLPLGATKIEVRVNGVQKRVATVIVNAGRNAAVKLRSSDANP
jgi:hypothetical protein